MKQSVFGIGLALTLACASAEGEAGRVEVERSSPATQGDHLTESIGIETEAGRFTPILEAGCALPCEDTVTFGTMEPDQTDIVLFLYRGVGEETATAQALGTYEITGYPADSSVDIAITFRADRDGISLSTQEAVTLQRSADDEG